MNQRLELIKQEAEVRESESFDEAERRICDAAELEEKAQKELAEAEKMKEDQKKEVALFEEQFERGMDAVDDGKIAYRPADENNKEDGLIYGPNAPEDAEEREVFAAPIRRAIGGIKKYARRIWNSDLA